MLKNERKINYLVWLARKGNDHHRSWTRIQMNFWPLVHPCLHVLNKLGNLFKLMYPEIEIVFHLIFF